MIVTTPWQTAHGRDDEEAHTITVALASSAPREDDQSELEQFFHHVDDTIVERRRLSSATIVATQRQPVTHLRWAAAAEEQHPS